MFGPARPCKYGIAKQTGVRLMGQLSRLVLALIAVSVFIKASGLNPVELASLSRFC